MSSEELLKELRWRETPTSDDYTEAFQYLTLLTSLEKAQEITERLIDSENRMVRSTRDILLSSGVFSTQMGLMAHNNLRKRIAGNEEISPLLIVQTKNNSRIHVVSGFQSALGLYWLSEASRAHCIITAWETL